MEGLKQNKILRVGLLILGVLIVVYLGKCYLDKQQVETMENNNNATNTVVNNATNVVNNAAEAVNNAVNNAAEVVNNVVNNANNNKNNNRVNTPEATYQLKPSYTSGENQAIANGLAPNNFSKPAEVTGSLPEGDESYATVSGNGSENAASDPTNCYPKDQLSPEDLLPGKSDNTWSQVNPSTQGNLGDQNFLKAGYHVGINTVGQSLRNANLQLRSEPANPQMKVSPWLQSTIGPDTNRKAMEIGN